MDGAVYLEEGSVSDDDKVVRGESIDFDHQLPQTIHNFEHFLGVGAVVEVVEGQLPQLLRQLIHSK